MPSQPSSTRSSDPVSALMRQLTPLWPPMQLEPPVIPWRALKYPSQVRSRHRSGAMSARILLIEDDEINRDLLSPRLLRRGYEVRAAADGETGLEVVERERPDLILMDI